MDIANAPSQPGFCHQRRHDVDSIPDLVRHWFAGLVHRTSHSKSSRQLGWLVACQGYCSGLAPELPVRSNGELVKQCGIEEKKCSREMSSE